MRRDGTSNALPSMNVAGDATMELLMRIVFALLFLVAAALPARAQGLVQVILEGEVETTGGARIEADVTFVSTQDGRPHTFSMALLLGARTSAVDVAGLLAQRLDQAGARVIWTGSTAPMRGPASLFVQDVTAIGLRLGRGLNASVTLCEDRPLMVKLSPGEESTRGATLLVAAQTYEPQVRKPGRFSYDLEFQDKSDGADAASKMVKSAIDKGWFSELEGQYGWRPGAMREGAAITSLSLHLRSNADWRIDVTLLPRATQR
jgi:hypothetical protein